MAFPGGRLSLTMWAPFMGHNLETFACSFLDEEGKAERTVGNYMARLKGGTYLLLIFHRSEACGVTNLTSRQAGKCCETRRFGRRPIVSATTIS